MQILPQGTRICATQSEPRGKESSSQQEPQKTVDTRRLAQMMTHALRILRDDQSLSVKPATGNPEVSE